MRDFDSQVNPKIKALEEAANALGGDIIKSIVKRSIKSFRHPNTYQGF